MTWLTTAFHILAPALSKLARSLQSENFNLGITGLAYRRRSKKDSCGAGYTSAIGI